MLAHKGEKLTARILDGHPLLLTSTLSHRTLTVSKLLSPLAPRDITAIRGLGLQYPPDPAKPVQPPAVPCLFFKPSSSVAGPGDEIVIPSLAEGEKNDYECELCVVIGRDAKDVKEEDALNYLAGCVEPPLLSSRFKQCTDHVVADTASSTTSHLADSAAKASNGAWARPSTVRTSPPHPRTPKVTLPLAAWCPIGPCLVSPAALGKAADALALTTHINGQLAQKASTADLVIKVVRLSLPSFTQCQLTHPRLRSPS